MNRTVFLKLGITLAVSEAWLPGCASDNEPQRGFGTGGAAPGAGGSLGAGTGGVAGASGATGASGAGVSGANGGGAASASGGATGASAATGATAAAGNAAGSSALAGSGPSSGQCSTDANLVQTSMESHDHLPLTMPITAADLNAGSPTEYALALDQNHIHTLSFTPAEFSALRAGMMIMKRSSVMMGHTHTYSIKCV